MGTEDVSLILRKLESIDNKMDAMQEQRYTNGLAVKELEGRVNATESFVCEQKDLNKDNKKYWRKLNQKMWMFIAGGVIGFLFFLLEDQII